MERDTYLLTEDEVAAQLSVSPAAVRKWRGEGKIVYVKLGTLVRFRPSDVEDFVARGMQAPVCPTCTPLTEAG